MKSLAEKIKDTGLTQKHIASKIGIDTATLSRIINGKQQYVAEETLKKLHDYLDSRKE